jgi:hypothetical protein
MATDNAKPETDPTQQHSVIKSRKPRRSRGEGTIYQTKAGRWEAMVGLPSGPGGRRRRKFTGKTREEVRASSTRLG